MLLVIFEPNAKNCFMDFYTSISSSYDHIFSYNPLHLTFIENLNTSLKDISILDVGCSTGSLAMKLAEQNALVYAIDTDAEMVRCANSKKKDNQAYPVFKIMDMLKLESNFHKSSFHHILCFGNTLVHLSDLREIEFFFGQVFNLLTYNGQFSFQILNYSHILKHKVPSLPLIDNDKIRFERKYHYEQDKQLRFETYLKVKQHNTETKNSIILFALELGEAIQLLEKVGFKDISYYSNFKAEPYAEDSYSLVMNAKKS